MKLGLIGHGAVARQALSAMAANGTQPLETLIAYARPDSAAKARDILAPFAEKLFKSVEVVTDLPSLVARKPDVVAEAAGHKAVTEFGSKILRAGADFLITSAGALASASLRERLDEAAADGQSRWHLCAGAIGGLEILAAAQLSGIAEVLYASRKPPHAWVGTPAEALIELATLDEAVTFYEGDANGAARDYPQNANVAATVALAGAGFEKTRVRLIADPAAAQNIHEITIHSGCADVEIRIAGKPSPDNPKTSLTTGYALAAHILQMNRQAQRH